MANGLLHHFRVYTLNIQVGHSSDSTEGSRVRGNSIDFNIQINKIVAFS